MAHGPFARLPNLSSRSVRSAFISSSPAASHKVAITNHSSLADTHTSDVSELSTATDVMTHTAGERSLAKTNFVFTPQLHFAVTVAVVKSSEGAHFERPPLLDSRWDTVLLELGASARMDCRSQVVVEAAGERTCQYLAPGRQRQWLNLSSCLKHSRSCSQVALRAHDVILEGGEGTLYVFDNEIDLSQRVLVLAPHPDDAEIAAFGLYAHRNATVVTITAGNAGPMPFQDLFANLAQAFTMKGRIRAIDSVTIPWQGGISPECCFNLGYFDGRLERMHNNPDAAVCEMHSPNSDISVYRQYNIGSLLSRQSRQSTWRNLVSDLASVLARVNPDIIVSPHPLLDGHGDHQFTTVALAEALELWMKPVRLLLYTNHADDNRFPYGPAGTVMSLPPATNNVPMDGVYSHEIDSHVQRLKLLALESMHDIRSSYRSYLQRGLRANEIFCVYNERSVRGVVESFLSSTTQVRRDFGTLRNARHDGAF